MSLNAFEDISELKRKKTHFISLNSAEMDSFSRDTAVTTYAPLGVAAYQHYKPTFTTRLQLKDSGRTCGRVFTFFTVFV